MSIKLNRTYSLNSQRIKPISINVCFNFDILTWFKYNTNSKKPHSTVLDFNYEIGRVKRGENEKRVAWIKPFSIKS